MAPFDIQELRDLTAYDELELDTLGDRKAALFIIISDTDDTFNFLVSMAYTQLLNLLCEKADDVYGGRIGVKCRNPLKARERNCYFSPENRLRYSFGVTPTFFLKAKIK